MALIKCPECGKEISDQATACPNCGCPVKQSTTPISTPQTSPKFKKKKNGCFVFIIIVFLLFLGLGVAVSQGIKDMEENPEKYEKKDNKNGSDTSIESSISPESIKQNAQIVDEQLWSYVLPIINSHNQLMKIMGDTDSYTDLDIYNAAKDFKKMCQEVWDNPPEVSGNGADEYLKSCMDYIIIEQTMAKSLMKYVDNSKTSNLSKAEENIQSCSQAIIILASNRGTFLAQNGFSDEEIAEVVGDLGIEE